jgi:hypothetical protein
MFIWCATLFFLGIAAFLDSIFNYGNIFRQLNSVLFMLISLGLLVRTTTKMRAQKIEKYESRIESLERQLKNLRAEKEEVPADY